MKNEHSLQVRTDLEEHEVQTDGLEDRTASEGVVGDAFARAGTER